MKNNALLALFISTLSPALFAGTMGPVQTHDPFVTTLSLGPTWTKPGQTQTFFLAPEIEKTYVANKPSSTMINGEIFIGLSNVWTSMLTTQLGLAVNAAGNAALNGVIWDDADPIFDNYIYNYSLKHQSVSLEGKILADGGYWLIPWVKASIGVGFNQAYGFNNIPVIFEAVPNSNFQNNTTTAFTYTAGAGVQKALNEHWQVGVGYEFSDWGKSRLNPALGQTTGSGLELDHLYTNGVLFNITYQA